MQILADNYHQPLACKGDVCKQALQSLRSAWQGVQIYLRGGVRLIRPPVDPNSLRHSCDAIRVLIIDSGKDAIYLRDINNDEQDTPDPGGPAPVVSVAHPLLQYGAIVDNNFYSQLRAARAKAKGEPTPDSDTEDTSGSVSVPAGIQRPGGESVTQKLINK